jgi:hypothetical protein
MRRLTSAIALAALVVLSWMPAASAPRKQHTIAFGRWINARWSPAADEQQSLALKVRPLYIDERVKEFTTGLPRDITDRVFAVRRAYRLNDQLPGEAEKKIPQWRWERGGWLLVDRSSGRVSPLNLPLFDVEQSAAAWFRDYAAYCGLSEDGEKVYAVVAQVGRKKPLLKKELGAAARSGLPDSECAAATWQRAPVRITFHFGSGAPITFAVRGHSADLISEAEEE